MTTLKFTKTAFATELLKGIALLAFCSFVFLGFYRDDSRNLSKTNDTSTASAAPVNKAYNETGPVGDALQNGNHLYTLYIENTAGSEQLKKLLGDSEKQKLVLQLFRGAEGYLQLMAFPSTNGNGRYFLRDAVELSRSNVFTTTMPEGENIFFGDLQVANKPALQKWTIRDLKAHLYNAGKPGQNAGWEYILFVPKIIEVSEETFSRKYVVYDLERSDERPQASSKKASFLKVSLDDEANPSPPRKLE